MKRVFKNGAIIMEQEEHYLKLPWVLLKSGMSVNAIILLSFGLTRPEDWMFSFEGTGKILCRDVRWVRRHYNELVRRGYVRRTVKRYSPRLYYYEFADNPMFYDDVYCARKRAEMPGTKSKGLESVPEIEGQAELFDDVDQEGVPSESVSSMKNRGAKTEGLESVGVSKVTSRLDTEKEEEEEERRKSSSSSSGVFREGFVRAEDFEKEVKKLKKKQQLIVVESVFESVWEMQKDYKRRWRAELESTFKNCFRMFVMRWAQGFDGQENWLQIFETLSGEYTVHWAGIDKFSLMWVLEMLGKKKAKRHWDRICSDVRERRQRTTEKMELIGILDREIEGFGDGIMEHKKLRGQAVKILKAVEKKYNNARGATKKDLEREVGVAHQRIKDEDEWIKYFEEITKESRKIKVDFIDLVKDGLSEGKAMAQIRKTHHKRVKSPGEIEADSAKKRK